MALRLNTENWKLSAPANRTHDLNPVTVVQLMTAMLAGGHNFSIDLYGNTFTGQRHLADEVADTGRFIQLSSVSVDCNF
jgi:hypothetical protein